jgi:hypothetical protein
MESQSKLNADKLDNLSNQLDKSVKGVRDFPEFTQNPFMEDIIIQTSKRTVAISSRKINIVNTRTGELEDTALLHVKREIDKEKFVKVFISQLQFIFELSQRALKIVAFFMNALRINDDQVYFDLDDCKKYTGYGSKQTIFSGMAELLEHKVIAKSTKNHIYYINPKLIFNGNRLVVVNEFCKKRDHSIDLRQISPDDSFTQKTILKKKTMMLNNPKCF